MGLKCSPDIAQAAMENVLSDIEDTNIYIDDVGAFSNDWDHHVNLLGCINYYRDMWPSRAHILKPLTDHSSLKKRAPINRTDEMQKMFDKMHLLMAANALAAYPHHNKRFHVYTDASDFQLGACIIQEGKPVAYFSQKLTKSQQNYTTMEKEMLSIVATLKEFRSMLLGADIHVFYRS